LEPINKRGGIFSSAAFSRNAIPPPPSPPPLHPAYGKPTAGNEGEINGISFCMTRTGKRNGNEKNRAGDIPRERKSLS